MEVCIDQQCHGYRSGHQVLAGSIRLPRGDQDLLDRLSDVSGPLRPGESFLPYITAYPLPSAKYYIFARTWQDLEAPRAGCVLTRSLILPMQQWETLGSVFSLIDLLEPVDRNISEAPRLTLKASANVPPMVTSTRAGELVEALLLESRKAIVMFEEPQAELISERLLSAFWPSMRRNFSVCTFALAPRTAGGRPFDLLFAPRNARPRFSEWSGRRIESTSDTTSKSRHRWTAATVQQIFQSDQPSLMAMDALGALQGDERGDESILRLSLLWNELVEKSETSPTAILGLLDILNSQGLVPDRSARLLTPFMIRAIDLAVSTLQPVEAIDFLVTLLGKFTRQKPPTEVIRKLQKSSEAIAYNSPANAFAFLKREDDTSRLGAPIVLAGVGDGLGRAVDYDYVLEALPRLSADTVIRLVAFSRPFARRLVRSLVSESRPELARFLARVLDSADTELRARARRTMIPQLDDPDHAPILAALLQGCDTKALISVVHRIWTRTHFEIEAFDEPLCRAAKGERGLASLRSSILEVGETDSSNRFLLSTMRADASDIRWLLNEESMGETQRSSLLITLLAKADEREMQSLAQNADISPRIEDALVLCLPLSARSLARLLIWGGSPSIERTLLIGWQTLQYVKGAVRTELILSLLSRGLSSAPSSLDHLVRKMLFEAANDIDPHQLIILATPPNCAADRASSNIRLLNEMTTQLRDRLLSKVDELTARLVQRLGNKLDSAAVNSWATMLEDAGEASPVIQLRAASSALSYALASPRSPVSPLLIVAFPLVYQELNSDKETPNFFSFFFFADWDRCKILRRDIVRAFMSSSWPPADLLLASLNTGDTQLILQQITHEREGKAYLTAIEQDLRRLPNSTRVRLEGELRTFCG